MAAPFSGEQWYPTNVFTGFAQFSQISKLSYLEPTSLD